MICAIYMRETSNKNNSNGLRHQEDLNYSYIREKNWSVYGIYVDFGSGTSHQENFHKMIEDVQNRKLDAIIATDPSRLFRNAKLSNKLIEVCKKHNVHILTIDNVINTLQGDYQTISLISSLYELESQRRSLLIKEGKRKKSIQNIK